MNQSQIKIERVNIIIGLVSGIIGIFAFITGYSSLSQIYGSSNSLDVSNLVGKFQGTLDSKSLTIQINSIKGATISGFNVAGNNKRPITGVVIKKTDSYKLILIEPGDHKWDGKFEINLEKDDTKIIGIGTFKSYDGKLNRVVKINKI